MNKAIIITILLTILCISLEFLCAKLYATSESQEQTQGITVEKFEANNDVGSCNSCKVENFTPAPTPVTNAPKCRIVCDGGDNKIEGFDPKQESKPEIKPEQKQETKPEIKPEQKQESKHEMPREMVQEEMPANDDKYYWNSKHGKLAYDDRYGFGGMFYDENPAYNRYRNNDYAYSQNRGTDKGDIELDRQRQKREEVLLLNTKKAMEEKASSTAGYATPYQEPGAKSEKRQGVEHNRRIEGELDDEFQEVCHAGLRHSRGGWPRRQLARSHSGRAVGPGKPAKQRRDGTAVHERQTA